MEICEFSDRPRPKNYALNESDTTSTKPNYYTNKYPEIN